QLAAIAATSRIVPVIYGAMSPSSVPLLLRSRLFVDFRNPDDFERSVAQLLSAFADQPDGPQHPPSLLRLVDLQIARRMKSGQAAIEVLLTNTGKRTVSVKSLRVNSSVPYHVAYAMPPSTIVYPLSLTIGPRTANGIAVVGGAIGHEAEEWRRPVAGRLVLG